LAQIHAPTPTFISDPTKSGVKFVQAISTLRKRYEMGLRCDTHRTDEGNIASGWQLDTTDPYSEGLGALQRFSILGTPLAPGSDFSIATDDFPGSALTRVFDYQFVHAMYIDDRFETYVVYFAGDSAGTPLFQRPLAKLVWNWGGLVVFDADGHHIRYSNAAPGNRTGEATNSMVAMQGNVLNNSDVPCPGDGPLSTNRIDSSRELVKYYYRDILGRNPDSIGWNNWTSNISQCVFEWSCLRTARPNTGVQFFWGYEFRQQIAQEDPVMAAGPGTSAEYNRRFVYWCYKKLLRRDPDEMGWNNWTNTLNATGDYNAVVFGFIYSSEYRDRPFD